MLLMTMINELFMILTQQLQKMVFVVMRQKILKPLFLLMKEIITLHYRKMQRC